MKQEDFKFIGVDAGNSAVKYAYFCGGQIRFGMVPNITGRAIALDIPPASPRDEEIISVRVLSADDDEQRKEHFVGELARRQLQEYAGQDRSRNKADSDSVNIILPAVLGLRDTEEPIVLGVGATLQDYATQAPLLQKKLTRRHEIVFRYGSRAGQSIRPNVVKTYTYAQAAAGLISLLRTDEGRIRRTDWNDQTILAIDFGHGQINVAVMDRLQFVMAACFAMDYGFYRVVSAAQNYLNTKHYVTASIPQLQEAVEKGFYLKNNSKIDLRQPIDSACEKLTDKVVEEIKVHVPSMLLDRVSTIVAMGGGGKTMAPFVGSAFPAMKLEIAENSLFANARGLLLVAREKWEKENALR